MKEKMKRIHIIDTIRGIAIIAMVCHHVLFALESFYGVDNALIDFMYTDTFDILQFIFVALFILICGISSNFSRSNVKRGIICLGAGIIVTIATLIYTPDAPTYFGILQLLGSCMLIYGLLQEKISKLNQFTWLLIFSFLFIVNYSLYIKYQYAPAIKTDAFFIFGVISNKFVASDYYPLLPYIWLFLAGTIIGKYITSHKFPKSFYKIPPVPVITWVGRHTIWVYLAHMPVALLIMELCRLGGLL